MNIEKKIENVVIIGGGPAGLAAAVYNARANISPVVFAGSPPGGQLTLTTEVENYPGYESILGPELIEKMRNHAKKFGTRIIDENVLKVDFSTRPFKLFVNNSAITKISSQVNSSGNRTPDLSQRKIEDSTIPDSNIHSQRNFILASSVIIATGAKALWLGIESETRLRGKGVSACATCDGFFFRNKVVAVVGGGDTALEEALTLTRFASKVYLIHRRDSFRASKIMQDRALNHEKIEVLWNTTIEEVMGENKVEGLKLKSVKTSQSQLQSADSILKVDGVFIAIGHKPDTELFKEQVVVDEKGYIITSAMQAQRIIKLLNGQIDSVQKQFGNLAIWQFDYQTMTSIPGVFAAGDNVDHTYRQAATAVGMGVAAALDVERWLDANPLL